LGEVARDYGAHRKIESLFGLLSLPPQLAAVADLSGDVPSRIGRYPVVRLLGRGISPVYLAYDERLGRPVAIKVASSPRAGLLDDARKAARLDHEGIVTIYAVEEAPDGSCHVVMEYLEGGSLAGQLAAARKLAPGEAAELIAAVADAVHHAHRNGFVHRDLKPENILFDREGRPHLADFGLAVHESEQRDLAGHVSGTWPYMAPEQVRGEVHRLDGRTDIWGLGVILYRLLTGRTPFQGRAWQELFDEILSRHPKPLRQIDDAVPEQLERICLKCLAKDVTERYGTAADLARDLRRFCHPRRRPAALPAAAVLPILLTLCGFWLLVPSKSGQPLGSPPAAAPLSGTIDVLVWSPQDKSRQGLAIGRPGALPLRAGDQVRVEARLTRLAYAYIVWIDSQGKVSPVYPWKPGYWTERPREESPAERIGVPEAVDQWWPMQPGPSGTETVLLLARETPLGSEVGLEQLLSGLPRQPRQHAEAAVWFVNGQSLTAAEDPTRAPKFGEAHQVDNAVLQTQRLLQQRLGKHFAVTCAVSFSVDGGREP